MQYYLKVPHVFYTGFEDVYAVLAINLGDIDSDYLNFVDCIWIQKNRFDIEKREAIFDMRDHLRKNSIDSNFRHSCILVAHKRSVFCETEVDCEQRKNKIRKKFGGKWCDWDGI